MSDWSYLQFPAFLVMVTGYGLGALVSAFLSLVWRTRLQAGSIHARLIKDLGFTSALVSSVAGCVLALAILLSDQPLHVDVLTTELFGVISINADQLSAFFLGVISLLGFAVSIYSFGYAADMLQRRNIGLLVFLYNLFLLSMVGVVISGHAIMFIFIWETMSLTTYFLIVTEHEEAASRRAGFLYIVMTHIGTAFLVVMFVLLYTYAGSLDFIAFKNVRSQVPELVQTIVFLCAVIGFGIKSGIIPLHIWLPEAHPAAPSNVSALMSGVMIKTGIYGMVRVFFDFLGPDIPLWWGVLILVIAVSSSVLGVLYALLEHDLKRLLAFHSIENIGIILIGVGGALLFVASGEKSLAAIALLAGLFHVLNHATFKGLLFLGAGSVHHATHSRNIEEMGGLIHRMPWTALFFLVGAVAISALPPLNGFVSEWLTYQALLAGFSISDMTVKIAIPLTVALLAMTGALAAACFVKAFGITFLGLPRSVRAEHAQESSSSMIAAMGMLALLCVVFGVAPGLVVSTLDPVVGSLLGGEVVGQVSMSGGMIAIPMNSSTSVSSSAFLGVFLILMLVPLGAGFFFGGKLRRRVSATWACGLPTIAPRMQYTATGFSKPIRMIFSNVFRARHEIEISEETSPYFRPNISYELRTEALILKFLYEPVVRFVVRAALLARRIQTGHIQSYLAYIFITLVVLLLFAR